MLYCLSREGGEKSAASKYSSGHIKLSFTPMQSHWLLGEAVGEESPRLLSSKLHQTIADTTTFEPLV